MTSSSSSERAGKKPHRWSLLWWLGGATTLLVVVGTIVAIVNDTWSITERLMPQGAEPTATVSPDVGAGAAPDDAQSERYNAGWGPERDLFTTQLPAPYAAINSIVDNPAYGDERNFVRVRLERDSNTMYTNNLLVEAGDVVVVYVSVNNNAADNLTDSSGSLHGLTARAIVGENSSTDHYVSVTLSAKNAVSVWDGALLISRDPVAVSIVEGSAVLHSAGAADGIQLDDPAGDGALLGYTTNDGVLPVGKTDTGQEKGSAYLTFRLDVVGAD